MDLSKPLFHIRHAEPADAAAIVRLIQELAESLGEQSPKTHGYAQIHLSFPDRGLLLEEKAGAVIGLLSNAIRSDLDHAAPIALIEKLVVSKAARDQGVGSALLQTVEHHLRQAGYVEISVSVMPENQRAAQFYRAHGLTDEAIYLEKHLEV